MKLATLRTASPDGELIVVSRDLARMASAADIVPTLQAALDQWDTAALKLAELYGVLNAGEGEPFDARSTHSRSDAANALTRFFVMTMSPARHPTAG